MAVIRYDQYQYITEIIPLTSVSQNGTSTLYFSTSSTTPDTIGFTYINWGDVVGYLRNTYGNDIEIMKITIMAQLNTTDTTVMAHLDVYNYVDAVSVLELTSLSNLTSNRVYGDLTGLLDETKKYVLRAWIDSSLEICAVGNVFIKILLRVNKGVV